MGAADLNLVTGEKKKKRNMVHDKTICREQSDKAFLLYSKCAGGGRAGGRGVGEVGW